MNSFLMQLLLNSLIILAIAATWAVTAAVVFGAIRALRGKK